jgi:thiol-disulfide isomerase/thioredoxin
MIRMLRDWGAAVVVGLLVFFVVDWLSQSAVPSGAAPAFELVNVAGGTTKLADYAGKTVILNFWGSWCPPCRQEIPGFAAYATAHPDTPILGIAYNSGGGDKLAKDAKRLGITYAVLESDRAVIDAYGVDVFPTTVVVRPDGTIAKIVHGAIDEDTLAATVAAAK